MSEDLHLITSLDIQTVVDDERMTVDNDERPVTPVTKSQLVSALSAPTWPAALDRRPLSPMGPSVAIRPSHSEHAQHLRHSLPPFYNCQIVTEELNFKYRHQCFIK